MDLAFCSLWTNCLFWLLQRSLGRKHVTDKNLDYVMWWLNGPIVQTKRFIFMISNISSVIHYNSKSGNDAMLQVSALVWLRFGSATVVESVLILRQCVISWSPGNSFYISVHGLSCFSAIPFQGKICTYFIFFDLKYLNYLWVVTLPELHGLSTPTVFSLMTLLISTFFIYATRQYRLYW